MTDIALNNGDTRLAASVYGPMRSVLSQNQRRISCDADPILFLHGFAESRDTWEETALQLPYRTWALDFRGHGHSDRASSYEFADYVSDAETVLAAIGRPTIIVGHSLGGCVAGVLAQGGHANVRAVFLEDPAWYLGEPSEWEKSAFPTLFSILSSLQAAWQQEKAPLETYLAFLSDAPSAMGGIFSDHTGPRHLLSIASAAQRQDSRCWGIDGGISGILAAIPTGQEFLCPVKIIQADPRFGSVVGGP